MFEKLIKISIYYLSIFILLLFLFSANNLIQAQKLQNSCNLNNPDSIALVKCLLRPVKRSAALGSIPDNLPTPLNQLIGKKIDISIKTLEKYLNTNLIKESEIGGEISKPLNKTRFLVIHDTSTNLAHHDFPTRKKTMAQLNKLSIRLNGNLTDLLFGKLKIFQLIFLLIGLVIRFQKTTLVIKKFEQQNTNWQNFQEYPAANALIYANQIGNH